MASRARSRTTWRGLEGDLPADQVSEGDVLVGHAQAQHGLTPLGPVGGDLLVAQVSVESVVAQLGVLALGAVALLDLLGGRVGLVGVSGLQQPRSHVAVNVHALALAVRSVRPSLANPLVPVEAEPLEGLDDLVKGLLGIAGGVGILDAEDEGSPRVSGVRPVEQARADHSDVGCSRGRRTEADADVGTGGSCFTHDSPIVLQGRLLHLLDAWARSAASHNEG